MTLPASPAERVFQPSPQQQDVYTFITDGQGNAFVVAVAGAGKTTTIINGIGLMRGDVGFTAYNSKIAAEISGKLKKMGTFDAEKPWLPIQINGGDTRASAGTFHSFGNKAWRGAHPKVKLDEKAKWDQILHDMPAMYHEFIVKLVGLAKDRALGVNNWLGNFGDPADVREWYKIINHYNLMESFEEGMKVEDAVALCQQALQRSIDMAHELIDFSDMIYMPIYANVGMKPWLQFDWLLVDEAQDTNPARRALAKKLLKRGGRVIFVGDPCQAIYGFTGADNDSVQQIIRDFRCTTLPLTVTYRCPKAVVKASQTYVKHIEAHESAPEGVVESIPTLDNFTLHMGKLRQEDAILCRKTKPLVELAYQLIRRKIACHVEGKEIGKGLIKLATKWKSAKNVDTYLDKLSAWSMERYTKMMAKGQETQAEAVLDRLETMKVICEGKHKMTEVVAAIEELFKDSDDEQVKTLTLSTIHKSKGREWHHVYFYGFREWCPSPYAKQDWEKEQEKNLIYVAFTRAQEKLVLVG
jgi:DNA helicase-2/ATP-dependent DNA helicase PcrA